MATSIPSLSKPLYTSPNFPTPIKFISLKFFVAKDNSSIANRLASCRVNSTPTCLPSWMDGSEDPVSEVLEMLFL
uniref:Uncharacterized protein n=1 Tax=Rhizophora mucronata TaxID=61149 RepID=A0A2P2JS77_RHIMU